MLAAMSDLRGDAIVLLTIFVLLVVCSSRNGLYICR